MVTLLIEHPITDFDTWRTAFGRFAERRRLGGVQAERIYQPVDEPQNVVITLDFAEMSKAVAFLEFLTTQVWANPAASPALSGTPRTVVLQPRETAASGGHTALRAD